MKMKAPGHRVLIKPKEVMKQSEGGILLALDEREYKANTSEGEVVSIGPTAWMAYDYWIPMTDKRNPLWEPWCKVGDKVYYAKYAAKWIEIDGEEFVLVNDQDVQIVKDVKDE